MDGTLFTNIEIFDGSGAVRFSIDGLRAYVAQMKTNGCDTIEFLMSSDEGFAPGGSQVLMYSEEEYQAIGDAAREAHILLVQGDPSADVAALQNKASLLAIMKGGISHKPPAATLQ